MNPRSESKAAIQKKIILLLVLLCVFLGAANFSSWKANVIAPNNLQQSTIGQFIQEAMAGSADSQGAGRLTLATSDLINRAYFPEVGEAALGLPIAAEGGVMGNIDAAAKTATGWELRGWTYIAQGTDTAEFVIAVNDGKVIGAMKISDTRPDVARELGVKNASRTGYSGRIAAPSETGSCKLTLFTLSSSLKLYAMPNPCDKATESPH